MMRMCYRRGPYEVIAGSIIALLSLGGCTSLDAIIEDQCGNRVVESEAGEDCDGESGCSPAGTENQCRYTCGSEETPTCPPAYGCGADGLCRRASGELTLLSSGTTVTARDILVGDLNADGCAEAVISASRSTVIKAFSSSITSACLAGEQTISTNRPDSGETPLPQPSLVDLAEGGSRLSLVAGSRGLFGGGLSVYFTSGSPTVTPVLFPVFKRPGASVRTLRVRLRTTDGVLVLEQPEGGAKTDVTLVFDPHTPPKTFSGGGGGALPLALADIAALVAADVYDDAAAIDKRCDEVVIAPRGATAVSVYRVCEADKDFTFVPLQGPPLALDGGASLRSENQVIVARDINNDGHIDLVLNADDTNLRAAYGLGDGRFDSKSPLVPVPDGKAGVLAGLTDDEMKNLTRADSIFVAGDFDSNHPGVEYVDLPCPPSDLFSSPTCEKKEGSCEAIVADIDADGDDDIVSTEGQELDVAVRRRVADGTFHVSFLKTTCPPHEIGVGDLDADGVSDIAFFDQASKGPDETTTSLSVAYGNPLGDPSAPAASGRFDEAEALSVVGLGKAADGAQLVVSRTLDGGKNGVALGVVEIGNERALVAPFYFPSSLDDQTKKTVELIAQAPGRFVESADGGAGVAMAVITKSDTEGNELWLVGNNADAGSFAAASKSASQEVPCNDSCMLAALPGSDGAVDKLLLLGDATVVVYEVDSGAFIEVDRITTPYTFRSIIDGSNPAKYAQRPLVGLLDGDVFPDVLARDKSGALIALFGTQDGGLDAQQLVAAPSCVSDGSCAGYAAAQIDADGDGALDLAVVGPSLVTISSVVTSGGQRSLLEKSVKIGIPAPPMDADFTALSAADVDGDGVKDLFVMTSSNFFTVLRGKPVRE